MGKVLNLGSINIDHVYQMPQFVQPGQTLASTRYNMGAGGKGFNQSIALARAGVGVAHLGCIGPDGEWLRETLSADGVDCGHLGEALEPTGHAIIQVVPGGENAIVLHAGANCSVTISQVERALRGADAGDWFLCQNETSCVPEALRLARSAGLKTAYNAAPVDARVGANALEFVDFLFVNETEANALGHGHSMKEKLEFLKAVNPGMDIIVTLGAEGAIWSGPEVFHKVSPPACKVVDTTAAGDTFIGYCLAALIGQRSPEESLALASRAAAICVSREGAASSIPRFSELHS